MNDTHRYRDRSQRRRCIWPDCQAEDWIDGDLNVCWGHATIIRNHTDDADAALKARYAALGPMQEKRKADRESANVSRLAAGKVSVDDKTLSVELVYYLQVGDCIKIGYSKNANQRLRTYPPNAVVLAVELGGKDLEHQRHGQFHAYLAHGREWFKDTAEIREHIAALPKIRHSLGGDRARRGPANQRIALGAHLRP